MTDTTVAGAPIAPAGGPGLRPRTAALLTAIQQRGGRWSTRRVQEWRRDTGSPDTRRGTARRDLIHLARLGYLTALGPADGRHYVRSTP
jgi:hypothetical protein